MFPQLDNILITVAMLKFDRVVAAFPYQPEVLAASPEGS